MKKELSLILLLFLLFSSSNVLANIGPPFSVQRLYEQAPIVCKVTIESLTESPSIEDPRSSVHKQMLKTKIATMKINRVYKGDVFDKINVLYPYAPDIKKGGGFLSSFGWGWRNVEVGQTLLVFLKEEGGQYRFWYDVYDTYMPISTKMSSKAEGFQAVREDIINSIDDDWEISNESINQVRSHGWMEALPKLMTISKEHGYSVYVKSVAARVFLGDRSAITESFNFFDENNQFEQRCYQLSEDRQKECFALQGAQGSCIDSYIKLGTKKGQNLVRAIAAGKFSWLHPNEVNFAKTVVTDMITPEQILELGDKMSTTDCSQIGFNWKQPGDLFIEASGRRDWYYKIKSDYEKHDEVCLEMKEWWLEEGREIFEKEVKKP